MQTNPVQVTSSTAISFTQIAAGDTHSCGIDKNGTAYCWGDDTMGQLGDNMGYGSPQPVQVVSTTAISFTQIAASQYNTCGVYKDYHIYCWGDNSNGQVCNGNYDTKYTPVQVISTTLISFTEVGVGQSHTCGAAKDGNIYCWGYGLDGALGNGDMITDDQVYPVKAISTAAGTYTALSLGGSASRHSCALVR